MVILCDVLKAVIAVLIAAHIGGGFDPRMMPDMPLSTEMTVYYVVLFKYWAALFCLLGHMFPCMFHFKGGKGILSGGTIVWMIDWRIGLVVWVGFLLLFPADEVCISGICLGWGQLPFCHLVFLSGSGHRAPGVSPGSLDFVEAPEQHRPPYPWQRE